MSKGQILKPSGYMYEMERIQIRQACVTIKFSHYKGHYILFLDSNAKCRYFNLKH